MADSKEDIVRRGYQAFSQGDMDTLRAIMTADVVHSVPGNNPTSGEHTGIDDVLALYGQLFELSGGTLSTEVKSLTTRGDKVVVVHHSKAQREGKSLDADETIEFSFAGDKVSRLDETYADPAAEDAFWG
jgi:uncharacterized protein